MSKITLMGGLHVGLNRKEKVPVGDCEYSDTRYRRDLANESSQREITIKMLDEFWSHRCNLIPFIISMASCTIYVLMTLIFWVPDLSIQQANTVFPFSYFSDTRNSASSKTLRPSSSAWNLFLVQCFLSLEIEQPFVQICILETSDLFLTQLSFPFLINHHILYIQPLNCLKSTPFLCPHCHISNQGYRSLPQTIRRSSCGYCYSIATPTLPIHLPQVSKAIFFQWETDCIFLLKLIQWLP